MSNFEDSFNQDYNPYQAPEVQGDDSVPAGTPAEAIRRQYLSHEASIQSVGLLYLLGGILFAFGTVVMIVSLATGAAMGGVSMGSILIPVLACVQCVVGYGLRKLQGWARIPAGLLAVLGLLAFPIGTIINGYILYLLFGRKGQMVFSIEYQDVIEQTPHIKYTTSFVVRVLFVLLLALIGMGIVAALFVG